MKKRIYIVADGSTGDTISPVTVVREIKKQHDVEVYGVFDQAARTMVSHMGFDSEIEAGQIRFADIDYAHLLQEVDLAGRVKGMVSFLGLVSTMLSKSVPRVLDTWMALLEELHHANNLRLKDSIIIGNDLGATWLVQPLSLYLGPLIRKSFVSVNVHPWTPGPDEFEHHFTPHFIRPSFLPPALVNKMFRGIVGMQYASIGERYAEEYARRCNLDPASIIHFKDIYDKVNRHYTFERLTLAPREQARQQETPTVSIGGYPLDLRIDMIHAETTDAIKRAKSEGKKIITIALGSLTGTSINQKSVLSRLLDACSQRKDAITILIEGYASNVLDVPDNVVIVPYENYIPVFSESALVFISGGAGAFHYSLATGTPCICIPTLPDQITNAQWAVQEKLSPGYLMYFRMLNGNAKADVDLMRLINIALDQPAFGQRGEDIAARIVHNGLEIATEYALDHF
jgi:hypothetical protein